MDVALVTCRLYCCSSFLVFATLPRRPMTKLDAERETALSVETFPNRQEDLSFRQQFVGIPYLKCTIALAICLMAITAFLLAPSALFAPPERHEASTKLYYGKRLTPSNYTVIKGVFIQDSPTFDSTGYNLLNDSFGLIDKSSGRWQNFTE